MSSIYRSEDIAKFILRITVGLLMLFHGVAKLVNLQTLDFIKNQLEGIGMHPIIAYGVYVGEIVAPLLTCSRYLFKIWRILNICKYAVCYYSSTCK